MLSDEQRRRIQQLSKDSEAASEIFAIFESTLAKKPQFPLVHPEFWTAFDNPLISYIIIDPEYEIVMVNQKAIDNAQAVMGKKLTTGQFMLDYVNADYVEVFKSNFELALSGETQLVERELESVHGTTRYFEYVYIPVYDDQHSVGGVCFITLDVTERKTIEKNLAYQASIFDIISDAVIATNMKGYITLWNQGAENIYGWTSTETIGKSVLKILQTQLESDEVIRQQTELVEVGHVQTQVVQHHKDGKPIQILAQVSAIHDESDNVVGMVAINRDITERKTLEQQQQLLLREQQRVETLQQFIAEISHDLRTPLSTLATQIYTATRKLDDASHPAYQHLENSEQQVSMLTSMMDTLMDVSRLDWEHILDDFQFELNHIRPIVTEIIEMFQSDFERKSLSVDFETSDTLPAIYVDTIHIKRVITNLLSNAIRYTPKGGSIKIHVFRKQGDLCIEIADTGIGIDQEKLPRIFDRFYRAGANQNIKGTGIGLSIVKRIVELHFGAIEVTSKVGVGTSFVVLLPIPSD